MIYKEAIKEAKSQIDAYENMILYCKHFEPKEDTSKYKYKIEFLKIAIEALERQTQTAKIAYTQIIWQKQIEYIVLHMVA